MMKNVFKVVLIAILGVVFSCKNNTTEQNVEGRVNPLNEDLTKTTNYKKNGNFEDNETFNVTEDSDSINENWNLNDPDRQKALYSRFRMDDTQIEMYETALENWWSIDLDHPYDKLSANERIKEEGAILKEILNDSQFNQYSQWANDNDER
ncbi:hypothetical protein ES677_05930 [Bizionia gelidisalsuginis]|uniref:Uncharacterized protein n=1 Tax=Bizionia gelidisalsuginis TaxID=291188 RepID=A0ABY3MCG4_9FLAO|nr:hypothetical protein [Bizionia gelidisalsuginis]TYC14918.1 hypothetical protein ES677_05930 [Bizionia gelidisalsuginis]